MTASAWAQDAVPSLKTQALARAIARAEGFYVKGSVPNRFHNPGDIRAHSAHAYPGQVGLSKHGYVIFRSDADGWMSLLAQLEGMIERHSKNYNVNMTLLDFSHKYATSPTWVKNVSKILAVKKNTKMWEILGEAPVLEESWV
ncbi:MAG: hypothetical protein C5B59_06580 [Bacteroidetes bacterium]|nr:MAG: hypothetical protein C5B59_06580 [Bacteroidota bacterium]